jgi:alpha-D-ribose 1-methylphosphonate 5-triphosphate synthase subunit PhnH
MDNWAKRAIERHFLISVSVRRKTGQGPQGAVFASAVTIKASVNTNPKLVRLPNGQQVAPSASIAFSIDVAEIPLGSLVTTPGRAEAQVIQLSPGDGGGLPTPDHRMVWLG